MILAGLGLAYPKRICRIEPQHPIVLDEDLWNSVVGRGHQKTIIETKIERTRTNRSIPIRSTGAS